MFVNEYVISSCFLRVFDVEDVNGVSLYPHQMIVHQTINEFYNNTVPTGHFSNPFTSNQYFFFSPHHQKHQVQHISIKTLGSK